MSDHGRICGCAAAAIEDIIRLGFRVNITKALDPMDPNDYIVIAGQLADAMSRATRETEAEILNKAMDALDVDWTALNREQRARVVEASRAALNPLPARVIPPITNELTIAGPNIMGGARTSVRESLSATIRTEIGVSMSQRDQATLDHMVGSQSLYITDEYGRRSVEHGATATSIVENGIANGFGTDEIAAELTERLGPVAGLRRSEHYWRVIASTFANRSRVYSALSTMNEGGIEKYIFEAVMDERTTDQCAYLHGKTFSVASGLQQYATAQAAEDPEEVKDIQPWVRVGRDEEGNRILYTQNRDGDRQLVAQVVTSRVGTLDGPGSFTRGMSNDQLASAGITMPPLHGLCRSTIVADV